MRQTTTEEVFASLDHGMPVAQLDLAVGFSGARASTPREIASINFRPTGRRADPAAVYRAR